MDDVFGKYGGSALPIEEQPVEVKKPVDPFAAYGGQSVEEEQPAQTKPAPPVVDPFANYGGESDYNKLKKEQEAYGFMDLLSDKAAQVRGGRVLTKTTSNADIKTIADHWKIDNEELRSLAPYFMSLPPMDEATLADYAKRAAGAVGYGLLGDVPQFVFKKLQDNPNLRNALDDVRDLAEGRLGAGEFVAYNFLPTPKIGLAAKTITQPAIGKALAKGAATGAAYGLAGSREGEELKGAAIGAAAGGALSGAVYKLQSKLAKGETVPEAVVGKTAPVDTVDDATKQISLDYVKNNQTKLAEVTDEAWSHVADSEKAIADAAIKKRALTDDEVDLIVREQLSPDTVAVMAKGETGDAANRIAAEKVVADRRESFAESLAKDSPAYGEKIVENGVERRPTADEILLRASGAGKEDYFIDRFLGDSYVRTGQEQITKLGIRATPDAAPIAKMIVNGVSDRQYGVKTIDELHGTDALTALNRLNTNYNHMTSVNTAFNHNLSDVYKTVKKGSAVADATSDEGGLLFRALDENKENELPANLRDAGKMIRSFLDSVRKQANSIKGDDISSLNIAKREDFGMPNVLVRPVDYIIKMNRKRSEVNADLLAKMGKSLDQLVSNEDYVRAMDLSPALREYQGGLKFSYEAPITDVATLQDAIKSVGKKGATNPKLQQVASTTLKREEKIPDFLREKNVFRLMKRYSDNTFRTTFLRKPLADLVNQAKLLRASGAEEEARYIERLVADNLGIRAMSMARVGNEVKIKFAEAVDSFLATRIKDPVKRQEWVDTFRVLPELMANVQYNIYPNVLGLNPRAHLAQLTQTWFKNAPELGGKYGYELTSKGFTEAVLALRNKDARKLFYDKVQEYGLEPSSFVKEASEALADEITRSVSYNIASKAARDLAQKFMYTYGKMDTFNRAATVFMAERLASDLNQGNKGAFNTVNKMPISIRRALVNNKGNLKEQSKVLAQYLNAATQYNYNRPSMSEIGVVLGPMFSAFTKWPLATAGDIIADLRTKGMKAGGSRAVEKYGVTLLMASIIDNAIRYGLGGELDIGGDFKDYDDRVKKVIGTSGFVGMSPISSAAALLPGQKEKSLFTPPVVDALYNGVLAPMFTGDTDKALEQGTKALKTFAPGAFVYRFLMEDIPLYTTGEKPE